MSPARSRTRSGSGDNRRPGGPRQTGRPQDLVRYVGLETPDGGYYVGMDMPSALHPQTLLTFRFADQILPPKYGFPMKLRIPTKLGFKNPKYVVGIAVLNNYTGGYWEDKGYNWFSGL